LNPAAQNQSHANEQSPEPAMPPHRQRPCGRRMLCMLACALGIGLPPLARAQETVAATPVPAAVETTRAAATPATKAGALSLDAQVRWLSRAAKSGMLASMDDATLVALFESLDPRTLQRYVKDGPNGYPSYEFTMLRSERINGVWPTQPDHMLVRLTRDPMRIYVKWLADGAHAGQEILYDETTRADEIYGHLGGVLDVASIWTSLDGAFARSQSKHSVRDLGTEYITGQFLAESAKSDGGAASRPSRIEVKTVEGVRVVSFTFESSAGQPEFYAKKEVLGLDLRRPYFRSAQSYDNAGKIFESIVFETVTPRSFDAATFDPKNPDYKF
jgi:Protein of unknown function (DUF1571)